MDAANTAAPAVETARTRMFRDANARRDFRRVDVRCRRCCRQQQTEENEKQRRRAARAPGAEDGKW